MRNLAMAAVVVAGIGLTGCEDKAKPAAATVTDKAPSALAEAPKAANPGEAKVYAFGPENSKIGFKGAKITGSHLGGFNQFKGEIHASENLADASKVNVEIDLASVFTDAEKLTGHLKSPDFFDVGRHLAARSPGSPRTPPPRVRDTSNHPYHRSRRPPSLRTALRDQVSTGSAPHPDAPTR